MKIVKANTFLKHFSFSKNKKQVKINIVLKSWKFDKWGQEIQTTNKMRTNGTKRKTQTGKKRKEVILILLPICHLHSKNWNTNAVVYVLISAKLEKKDQRQLKHMQKHQINTHILSTSISDTLRRILRMKGITEAKTLTHINKRKKLLRGRKLSKNIIKKRNKKYHLVSPGQ